MNRAALEQLTKDELIGLVEALLVRVDELSARIAEQSVQITNQAARIAELEARLGQPPKTPDNSSTPPSRGQKPTLPKREKGKRRGRKGAWRALADNPDQVIEAFAPACPHCDHTLCEGDQPDSHNYDHVELPAIKPTVTRVRRHRGVCPGCRRGFCAAAPEGLAPGSPYGANLSALILHLHITQSIGFERLVVLLSEVFGVVISEGAIANILSRAAPALSAAAEAIGEEVRTAPVVASDETSARVQGHTHWQWVLLSSTAIYHIIAPTRSANVVADFLKGRVPEVWVADRYGGQNGHGKVRQVCLAHLLRDAQYAIDEGDTAFAPAFKRLLLRAVAIGRRRQELKDSTLSHYRADLDRRLDRLMVTPPANRAAARLWRAMRRCRSDLFRFITRRDVPYTNNACERALRPSVIFRKVTGCFRSEWGAKLYAAAQSVIATGRLKGKSALDAIKDVIKPQPELRTA